MLKELNQAIDYIEEHLTDDLRFEAISEHAGVSDYHFRKIFFYLSGMTLEEYVKNRRLAESVLTMEQARDILYENYVDAELFYPGELDKQENGTMFYCFVYDDGDKYCYAYVNSMTGEVEFVDEVENYAGEN